MLKWQHLLKPGLVFMCVAIFCEYLIYPLVILWCSWPLLDNQHENHSEQLKILVLADTHLLGSREGSWFDKLRREHQMERSFQNALSLKPDVVFVLGDLTDEGKWASDEEFYQTVDRFKWIFRHPDEVLFHVVVGNHDIGFHNLARPDLLSRFEKSFNTPSVKLLNIKNMIFLLVNSISLHGDLCHMCTSTVNQLMQISMQLNCSLGYASHSQQQTICKNLETLPQVKPILLQHFPMYRTSDILCTGVDAPPDDEKILPHEIRKDVLSKEASQQLLSWIRPRLILTAHTHHGCYIIHNNQENSPELTVPSFSWRNRNNPSFVMATLSKKHFVLEKCYLPRETSVITIYILALIAIFFWLRIKSGIGRRAFFNRFSMRKFS